jgi:glutamate formiminotransferase
MLLAVPNVSEGTDPEVISAIRKCIAADPVALLDEHSDSTHNRTVYTLAGADAPLVRALTDIARCAISTIDMGRQQGAHPRIGALDVAPIVWPKPDLRESARETALAVAEQLASLGLPVFLYGELAATAERRERAFFRRGGPEELRRRMEADELEPDLGPGWPHATGGAVLVTARAPLAAFNVELEGADLAAADAIAAQVRESGGGPPGVRAMAIDLGAGVMQISTNIHDPGVITLGTVVEVVRRRAREHGATPTGAELVGLVPAAALDHYPEDVPIAGEDPHRRTIEAHLDALEGANRAV